MLPVVTQILGSNLSIEETQQSLLAVVSANSLKRLNVQDELGDTLIIKCSRLKYTKVVDALIEKKVDINLANTNGTNPILISLMTENFSLTKQLVEAGCKINHADNRGQTALIWAASNKEDATILSFLIENGANVDAVDSQKCTALHLATANNMVENCRTLLQYGAKFDVLNNNFFSPFGFAVDNQNRDITQLFFSTIHDFKDLAYIDKFCYAESQDYKDFIQVDYDNTVLRLRLENNLEISGKNHKKLKI